jgi:hypothetical protein
VGEVLADGGDRGSVGGRGAATLAQVKGRALEASAQEVEASSADAAQAGVERPAKERHARAAGGQPRGARFQFQAQLRPEEFRSVALGRAQFGLGGRNGLGRAV